MYALFVPTTEQNVEQIQRMAARVIATNPVGHNLLLIGGFRYRLLDQSARSSRDIDYHWEDDLAEKQAELLQVCRRILIPRVRRELGFSGVAELPTGPEFDFPMARFVELRFWKPSVPHSQIVLPLELTRIIRMDPSTIRTADGIVYPTASDADMIEAKILAVLNRIFVEHRDFLDIFLYADRLRPDSSTRIAHKLQKLGINSASVQQRLTQLQENAAYHASSVQAIIDTQVEQVVAAQLKAGGGGLMVFNRALELIQKNLRT